MRRIHDRLKYLYQRQILPSPLLPIHLPTSVRLIATCATRTTLKYNPAQRKRNCNEHRCVEWLWQCSCCWWAHRLHSGPLAWPCRRECVQMLTSARTMGCVRPAEAPLRPAPPVRVSLRQHQNLHRHQRRWRAPTSAVSAIQSSSRDHAGEDPSLGPFCATSTWVCAVRRRCICACAYACATS